MSVPDRRSPSADLNSHDSSEAVVPEFARAFPTGRLREAKPIAQYASKFRPTTAERIARNDATFREANERIRASAEAAGVRDETVPFICECAEPACQTLVRLTLDQYGEVRADPRRFIHVPGHETADDGWARVVEEHDGYVIVEKVGEAADTAVELANTPSDLADPRSDTRLGQ